MDTRALQALSYGLYIISTSSQGKNAGCVVNTVTQITSSPVKIMVAVNHQNYTAEMIQKSGVFEVSVLTQDASMYLIGAFGFASSKDTDKFAHADYSFDDNGIPYVTQTACAHLSCKVVDTIDAGSHVLFLAEVVDAEKLSEGVPMTYAYYHAVKKGTTPPKASGYTAPAPKTGWRCKVCGYIYEGEILPADFVCPVCKQPASSFEKI